MNNQFVTRVAPDIAIPERVVVLENLSVLRLEWEAAADGGSLDAGGPSRSPVALGQFPGEHRLGLDCKRPGLLVASRLKIDIGQGSLAVGHLDVLTVV